MFRSRTRTVPATSTVPERTPREEKVTMEGIDELLQKRLEPTSDLVSQHNTDIGNLKKEVEHLKKSQKKDHNRLATLSGDALGGGAVRLIMALVAVVVAFFVCLAQDVSGWQMFWIFVAAGLAAFCVTGLVQLRYSKSESEDILSDDDTDSPRRSA